MVVARVLGTLVAFVGVAVLANACSNEYRADGPILGPDGSVIPAPPPYDPATATCGSTKAALCELNQSCGIDADCATKSCVAGICKVPSCTDGKLNGSELGVDCGGSCPVKCDGAACAANNECRSGTCANGKCAPKGTKTCGVGTAAPCVLGAICEQDLDCTTDYCSGSLCATPDAASHKDGRFNAGETGIDCGGAIAATQTCPAGQRCAADADCQGLCVAKVCSIPNATDGKKNNGESDVDCGGANAPKCTLGKACTVSTDCDVTYCKNSVCTAPTASDGVQNGNETDIDCGGARFQVAAVDYTAPKCGLMKSCGVDTDCSSFNCNAQKKCGDAKSCEGVHFGGDTCGTGEVEDGVRNHESCCKSLEVVGYSDPLNPGKTVYVDKYEITAGRIRAFVTTMAAQNGGAPNIKGWLLANKPGYWNDAWTPFLPEDYEAAETPNGGGNMGVNFAFGATMYYFASGGYGDPNYIHGANLTTEPGSYGFPTYWYDAAAQAKQTNATVPRAYPREQLDVKTATAIPNSIFMAFCHWDGGRVVSPAALTAVTGASEDNYGAPGGRLPVGNLNISADGAQVGPYFYPPTDSTADGAGRIAPGGRVPADRVTQGLPNQEPWADLAGNANEVTWAPGGTWKLLYQGLGYSSARAVSNTMQVTHPYYKAALSGARCMRFR
jgi:hypothetical protein